MIQYNPKSWVSLIFHSYSRHVVKMLAPFLIFIGLYTALLTYLYYFLQDRYPDLEFKSTTAIHSLLGIVLGLFLVFRMNSAYDRWWEARKIWGAVVNDSRSLGMESLAYPRVKDAGEEKEIAEWRRRLIMRHIGWLYALNGHLRKNPADISA